MKTPIAAYWQFNFVFLAVALSSLLGVGLINAFIDPYGVFRSPEVKGINHLKTQQFFNVRLFKAIAVTQIRPKTLLMGSSRADLGLDPTHPTLAASQPAYNLALVGPNMYEVRRYFEHALANQPDLETVVLGIDLFMFNEYKANEQDFLEPRLNRQSVQPQDFLNTVFSFDALASSRITLGASRRSQAHYLYHDNGLRYVHQNSLKEPMQEKFQDSLVGMRDTPGYYREFRLSPSYLADLQAIVETCKQRNITLKVFISPAHATQWELLHQRGIWADWENWKRQVVQMTPVWDFSGYNSITTEPISDTMQHYWDNSHYRQGVGNLILNRLFNYQMAKVPSDFGVLLAPDTIEAYLNQIRQDRTVWTQTHRDQQQLVQNLPSK